MSVDFDQEPGLAAVPVAHVPLGRVISIRPGSEAALVQGFHSEEGAARLGDVHEEVPVEDRLGVGLADLSHTNG